MNDILQLTIVLIASLISTLVSRRLKIPAVVGQMLVGILIAPSVLGLVHSGHVLEVMSEIGVILLMFLAGIESDLTVLKKNFKASMLVAVVVVQLILTISMAQLMMHMTLDVKCKEKEWNAL